MHARFIFLTLCAAVASGGSATAQETFQPLHEEPAAEAKSPPPRPVMVKYALLLPSDKTSERVKNNERNPFGKSGDDDKKLAFKGTNEENVIRDQLTKLRVSGASFDPDGRVVRVMLGDMILTNGQGLPLVVPQQTLSLKVGSLTPSSIELYWVEKKPTGLPPRKLVLPVDLRPFVRYRLLGQADDKKAALTSRPDDGKSVMGRQFASELTTLHPESLLSTAPRNTDAKDEPPNKPLNPDALPAAVGPGPSSMESTPLKGDTVSAAELQRMANDFLNQFVKPTGTQDAQKPDAWNRMNLYEHKKGFTVIEVLVAICIAAMVFGGAALAYHTMIRARRDYISMANIYIGNAPMSAFYGALDTATVNTYVAPSFGSITRAEALREQFFADSMQSIGVYCLYRGATTFNTVHPSTINSPPAGTAMDTPEGFRQYLITSASGATGASGVFTTSYRNYGATQNYSIFILGYSAKVTTIPVLAVYDVDVIPAMDPNSTTTQVGNYASVKRFAAGSLSSYYDVVYLTGDTTDQFYPGVVCFERQSRRAVTEGTSIDMFKVAQEKPFYFIFWPDPGKEYIKLPLPNTTASLNAGFPSTDPRQAYNHMAGRTSFMFVIPLFPSA